MIRCVYRIFKYDGTIDLNPICDVHEEFLNIYFAMDDAMDFIVSNDEFYQEIDNVKKSFFDEPTNWELKVDGSYVRLVLPYVIHLYVRD